MTDRDRTDLGLSPDLDTRTHVCEDGWLPVPDGVAPRPCLVCKPHLRRITDPDGQQRWTTRTRHDRREPDTQLGEPGLRALRAERARSAELEQELVKVRRENLTLRVAIEHKITDPVDVELIASFSDEDTMRRAAARFATGRVTGAR